MKTKAATKTATKLLTTKQALCQLKKFARLECHQYMQSAMLAGHDLVVVNSLGYIRTRAAELEYSKDAPSVAPFDGDVFGVTQGEPMREALDGSKLAVDVVKRYDELKAPDDRNGACRWIVLDSEGIRRLLLSGLASAESLRYAFDYVKLEISAEKQSGLKQAQLITTSTDAKRMMVGTHDYTDCYFCPETGKHEFGYIPAKLLPIIKQLVQQSKTGRLGLLCDGRGNLYVRGLSGSEAGTPDQFDWEVCCIEPDARFPNCPEVISGFGPDCVTGRFAAADMPDILQHYSDKEADLACRALFADGLLYLHDGSDNCREHDPCMTRAGGGFGYTLPLEWDYYPVLTRFDASIFQEFVNACKGLIDLRVWVGKSGPETFDKFCMSSDIFDYYFMGIIHARFDKR